MFSQPKYDLFVNMAKFENEGQFMEMISFGDNGPSAILATPMALRQLHNTALLLDNDNVNISVQWH